MDHKEIVVFHAMAFFVIFHVTYTQSLTDNPSVSVTSGIREHVSDGIV